MTGPLLADKVANLPLLPGVYIMKDGQGNIIYIGKAKVLRNRVSSYFLNTEKAPKVAAMVAHVADLEFVVTESEGKALALEADLISRHKPHYNILLKEKRVGMYLRVDERPAYPSLSVTYQRKKDGAVYYGPYAPSFLREAYGAVCKSLGVASCGKGFDTGHGGRVCLYRHLGQCTAPCTGQIAPEEYRELVLQAVAALRKDTGRMAAFFRREMEQAAEEQRYEQAARLRDAAFAAANLHERNELLTEKETDVDVVSFYADEASAMLGFFSIRSGRLENCSFYPVSGRDAAQEGVREELLRALYAEEGRVPCAQVAVNFPVEDRAAFEEWLSELLGKKVTLTHPRQGEKKRLCLLVEENARQRLLQARLAKEKDEEVMVQLAQLLHLEVVPTRIEAYDVSNSGEQIKVCGMVVFEDGAFRKKQYRTFRIRDIDGVDDYACMAQALRRRLTRLREGDASFSGAPDLILADGGSGHVHALEEVVREMGLDIPVFGMVKDDHHKARTLVGPDGEVDIAAQTAVFQLVFRISEEVHRFSLSKMDAVRRRKVRSVTLAKVPGIGERRAAALFKVFGTLENMAGASEEALAAVPTMNRSAARAVAEFFRDRGEGGKNKNNT
ncbi:MAG: excinuclease ABC subunit UvrC [Clostridia bacterium]|nr:excinuclease ABC subunit UvrC [Clostridia bacterium]